MEKKSMKGYLYLMPALIIILLFTAYPLVRAFLMSFYEDYNMISGEYSRIGLGNYKDLFGDKDFTKALWTSATECPVVFPGGVGVVPWMVPGGSDIAIATSELMKKYDAAVWAHHGLFVSGPDFDITFGLMHTIEKAAEIYVKALSCGRGIRQTISDDNLRAIAKEFGVTLNEDFLD